MEPTSLANAAPAETVPATTGQLTQSTRRSFIRGVAAAGASTAAAVTLDRAGVDLFADAAQAAPSATPFSQFEAIAPSAADVLEVPAGFRADVVIRYGDEFANDAGETFTWGYNNDFIAYFPLEGKTDEGLLFANHEYPGPFFQHGYKPLNISPGKHDKSAADVQLEQDSVGNSILHVKRGADGVWKVVSPSAYNRRIYGDRPQLEFTGPLVGAPGIGESANGSLGNCSGGVTPWGTALSCEENFDGYGLPLGNNDFQSGWIEKGDNTNAPDEEYNPGPPYRNDGTPYAKYGWVCEHDPYDPSDTGRKHTALGRFRHENAAFRQESGKPFVLYMGDDKANEGMYKFVSDRSFQAGRPANNRRILEAGTLYIARFAPEGRRRFTTNGDTTPITATQGTGTWEPVLVSELDDTATKLRARFTPTVFNVEFATNRPEDVEVHADGSVFVSLTNNSSVNDAHGSVRRLSEAANDPIATAFTWEDYAAGGPTGMSEPGRQGFSSPDNLTFDSQGNLWVVTDISSTSLNIPGGVYEYHANNAVFLVPTQGENRGVGFRFGNGPVESEITGPYFTPDEQTLFLDVQHPGENTGLRSESTFGDPQTYRSWWPEGNKTAGQNPSAPLPSLVAVTRVLPDTPPGSTTVPPPPATATAAAKPDGTRPLIVLVSPGKQSLRRLLSQGLAFRVRVDEPVTLTVTLRGALTTGRRAKAAARGRQRRLARARVGVVRPGDVTVRLRPSSALRLLLRRERTLPALLQVKATDSAGNETTRTKQLRFS